MKNIRKLLCLLLACALLLVGCTNGGTTATEQQAGADPTVAQVYVDAIAELTGLDYAMCIEYEKTVTVATQTYGETGEYIQEYWDQGTDQFIGRFTQNVTFGDSVYELEEEDIYSQGKFYQTLDEAQFYGEITEEDYISSLIPAQMLDPALYTVTQEGSVLTFADPTAVEAWVAPEEAILVSGSGKVELDADNSLVSAEYTVIYQHGGAETQLHYKMTPDELGKKPTVPEDISDYVEMDTMMSAYALEHAYGYLSQVKHLASQENSLVMSVAAGVLYQKNEDVATYSVGDEYAMRWETDVQVMDYTMENKKKVNCVQKYTDGKYTISEDGGREQGVASVTQEELEESIGDYLLDILPETDAIAGAELTHLGSAILVEFTGTEQMGEDCCTEICETLFNDGNLLNNLSSAYETKEMTFYLGLDAYSLLPTSFGIMYEGEHMIEGQACMLSKQLDKSFNLACLDSYDTIFEEAPEETEPENKATPLLYKVTGPDGQMMWLMGTIHVGDARTAYLPQEVYDAFDSSDALAIECNVDAFYDQMDEDEALAEKISDYYFYSDGTTAKDHIETPDLYEDAVKMMKATGNYNYNTEYLKVGLWSDSIDLFHTQQSYTLSSERGVEKRLLARAEENKMPVLEVESTEFQIKMTSDYSDHLQEVQLYSALCGDTHSTGLDIMELYDAWCAGDEKALTELLSEESDWTFKEEDFDLTGLTGEELERAEQIIADLDNINAELVKLQEEYEKAMERDRNKGMLDVAITYLEGDQVVFYAVGLAHLLAEDGLVNTLRAEGYTVELVAYA